MIEHNHDPSKVGIVVIGRNEGERLKLALASLERAEGPVVYVDSGSADGSVLLARDFGAVVHELDPARPFSAARARREGIEQLMKVAPKTELIQFLDGDCELDPNWLEVAAGYLAQHPDVAVVCGLLSESPTEARLYGKLSPQTWKQAVGDLTACGGIFMIRSEAYQAAGGFDASLLTREERALCDRIRAAGGRVVRIDSPMAQHDSGITTFAQWWARAVWGGYGDALCIRLNPDMRRDLRRFWAGVFVPPALVVVGVIGLFFSNWLALLVLLGLAAIALRLARIALARLRQGDSLIDSIQFSAFSILRNIAGGVGFMRYFLQGDDPTTRPDPRSHS